jgi:hypothetical protein
MKIIKGTNIPTNMAPYNAFMVEEIINNFPIRALPNIYHMLTVEDIQIITRLSIQTQFQSLPWMVEVLIDIWVSS